MSRPGFTSDQLRRWDALRRWAGVPDNAKATPEQMVKLLREASDDLLLVLVRTWDELGDVAQDCLIRNHDGQIEHYRERATAAENALRYLADRGYTEGATQAPDDAQDPRHGA